MTDGHDGDGDRTRTASHAGDVSGRGEILTAPEGTPLRRDAADLARLRVVRREDYEVRGELASGGMGRILEAWDTRHERPVAIKMRLEGATDSRRFAREIHITGRLQHPSIVPLYEAGRWPSGEPFFAMKLVLGESLARVVDGTQSWTERLALLPHLIAVADALAYAHEQHVVHRDLKPSNVIVGAFGETVVVDWGLAKHVDDPDEEGESEAPRIGEDGDLTQHGRALGTPCYMPPEQARGDAVDLRADVYALGALLYHVLAGVPPYRGDSAVATLEKVRTAPPVPLGEVVPELPSDLAAIVTKAMARDPAERYPSAKGLAEDLKRFATGQLVSVHAYSAGELLRRWASRRRAPLLVAAAMLAVLALTATMSVLRIVRERDRADHAKIEADRQRSVAVTQRDAAERIVEFVIGTLKERLEPLGKLQLLAGVGREVEGYYDKVASGAEDVDATALARRAAALQTLGDVEARKLDDEQALSLFLASLTMTERALAKDPTNVDARSTRVLDFLRIGTVLHGRGELDEALRHYGDGAREASSLVAAHPELPNAHVLAAKMQAGLGYANYELADLDAADAAYAKEVEAVRALVARDPTDAWRARLAWALIDRQSTQFETGHSADARVSAAEALAISEALTTKDPANSDALSVRAWAEGFLSSLEGHRGNVETAARMGLRARASRAELTRRDPENTDWQRDALNAAYHVCRTQTAIGRPDEALRVCIPARDEMLRLIREKSVHSLEKDVIWLHTEIASAHAARKEWALARASYDACIAFTERASKEGQGDLQVGRDQVACRERAAMVDLAVGNVALAQSTYEVARDMGEKGMRARPRDIYLAAAVARTRALGGDLALARKDFAEARRHFDDALALATPLTAKDPDVVELAATAARARIGVARVLRAQGDAAGARAVVAEGLAAADAWRTSAFPGQRAVVEVLLVESRL